MVDKIDTFIHWTNPFKGKRAYTPHDANTEEARIDKQAKRIEQLEKRNKLVYEK